MSEKISLDSSGNSIMKRVGVPVITSELKMRILKVMVNIRPVVLI